MSCHHLKISLTIEIIAQVQFGVNDAGCHQERGATPSMNQDGEVACMEGWQPHGIFRCQMHGLPFRVVPGPCGHEWCHVRTRGLQRQYAILQRYFYKFEDKLSAGWLKLSALLTWLEIEKSKNLSPVEMIPYLSIVISILWHAHKSSSKKMASETCVSQTSSVVR